MSNNSYYDLVFIHKLYELWQGQPDVPFGKFLLNNLNLVGEDFEIFLQYCTDEELLERIKKNMKGDK